MITRTMDQVDRPPDPMPVGDRAGLRFHRHARSRNVGSVPLDWVVSLVAASVRNDLAWYAPACRV